MIISKAPITNWSAATCKLILTSLLVMNGLALQAQPPLFKSPVYIERYAEEAVSQMVEYKIPASVILAQAIFESNCGTSVLAKKSNNHFGIKCHVGWYGDTTLKTDDFENECFRKYYSVEESYTDHSLFLKTRIRYAALFTLAVTDYKGWCTGLKNSGYATNKLYAEKLIKIIEDNKLFEMDVARKMQRVIFVFGKNNEAVKSKMHFAKADKKQANYVKAMWLNEHRVSAKDLENLISASDNKDELVKRSLQ